MKSTLIIVKSFIKKENGDFDQSVFDRANLLKAQYLNADISERTGPLVVGGRNHYEKRGTAEYRDALLKEMASLLKDLLPKMKNPSQIDNLLDGLPEGSHASKLIQKRLGQVITDDFLTGFGEKDLMGLISRYKEGPNAQNFVKDYFLEKLSTNLSAVEEYRDFNKIARMAVQVIDKSELKEMFASACKKFLENKNLNFPGFIELGKNVTNAGDLYFLVWEPLHQSMLESFLQLDKGKVSISTLLDWYEKVKYYSKKGYSYTTRRDTMVDSFFTKDEVTRSDLSSDSIAFSILNHLGLICSQRVSSIKRVDNIIELEGLMAESSYFEVIPKLEDRKKALVKDRTNLPCLQDLLSFEAKVNLQWILKDTTYDGEIEESPILLRMVELIEEISFFGARILFKVMNASDEFHGAPYEIRLAASERLRILLPLNKDKLETLDSLKVISGTDQVDRLRYVWDKNGSRPSNESTYLSIRKKEIYLEKLGKPKSILDFKNLESLDEDDQVITILETEVEKFLGGMSLDELDKQHALCDDDYYASRIRGLITPLIKEMDFITLAKSAYSDKTKVLILRELKDRIKNSALSDSWFIECIKKETFYGFKSMFLEKAQSFVEEAEYEVV
ncbi:hypothetical protein GW765_01640 [Candidatus Parcubacteria bacterium]|nr:hypothetical protein [Candidatus Parcubacteria bacterium]